MKPDTNLRKITNFIVTASRLRRIPREYATPEELSRSGSKKKKNEIGSKSEIKQLRVDFEGVRQQQLAQVEVPEIHHVPEVRGLDKPSHKYSKSSDTSTSKSSEDTGLVNFRSRLPSKREGLQHAPEHSGGLKESSFRASEVVHGNQFHSKKHSVDSGKERFVPVTEFAVKDGRLSWGGSSKSYVTVDLQNDKEFQEENLNRLDSEIEALLDELTMPLNFASLSLPTGDDASVYSREVDDESRDSISRDAEYNSCYSEDATDTEGLNMESIKSRSRALETLQDRDASWQDFYIDSQRSIKQDFNGEPKGRDTVDCQADIYAMYREQTRPTAFWENVRSVLKVDDGHIEVKTTHTDLQRQSVVLNSNDSKESVKRENAERISAWKRQGQSTRIDKLIEDLKKSQSGPKKDAEQKSRRIAAMKRWDEWKQELEKNMRR